MGIDAGEEEIASFLDRWLGSIAAKDIEEASSLREARYTATLPGGRVLTRQQELDIIGSPELRLSAPRVTHMDVRRSGSEALVSYSFEVAHDGEAAGSPYRGELLLARTGGRWRARRFRLVDGWDAPQPERVRGRLRALARHLPGPIKRQLRKLIRRGPARGATFQQLAYVPRSGGADYVITPDEAGSAASAGDELPIPPKALWLGYNYPVHGKLHVSTMLDIVHASGFSFEAGDRILDLGCGAGRMIRHLRDLAQTCEIWGADISAEHIQWCKHNLSPPFHFLTNTKVPHLPFEDRSFRFIYCGSLFTHIDDLADAWLLELHRLLAPDGRLYVTIHDRHTVELFEDERHASADIVKEIRSFPLFKAAAADFSFLSVGREGDPQVFYDIDYFKQSVGSKFEILSIAPEAYFYQTAVLLKRKAT